MSSEATRAVAAQFYDALLSGKDPETLAAFFSEDAEWDIPGDTEAVSWIGPRRGRAGVAAFIRELRSMIEPVSFTVTHTLAEGEKAVTLGSLESRVKATGKLIRTRHATEMTVRDGRIIQYVFFEDSFAVSQAVKP